MTARADVPVGSLPAGTSDGYDAVGMPNVAGLPEGSVVADGRLRIEHAIASGAMATVYRAVELASGHVVALKLLGGKYLSRADAEPRLFAEMTYAAALGSHPHIVRPLFAGHLAEADARPYLVSELVEGPTLDGYVFGSRPGLAASCTLLAQIANTLGHLHAAGIVHRDVKPGNVLVATDRGRPSAKLTDFGLATRVESARRPSDVELTGIHDRPGTKHYMAPEQCMGMPAAPAADVYALGVTAYELFVGEPPMGASELVDVVQRKCDPSQPPFALSACKLGLPAVLEHAIDRALAREPELRPNATELAEVFAAVAADLERAREEEVAAAARFLEQAQQQAKRAEEARAEAARSSQRPVFERMRERAEQDAVVRRHQRDETVVVRDKTEMMPEGFIPKPPAVMLAPELAAQLDEDGPVARVASVTEIAPAAPLPTRAELLLAIHRAVPEPVVAAPRVDTHGKRGVVVPAVIVGLLAIGVAGWLAWPRAVEAPLVSTPVRPAALSVEPAATAAPVAAPPSPIPPQPEPPQPIEPTQPQPEPASEPVAEAKAVAAAIPTKPRTPKVAIAETPACVTTRDTAARAAKQGDFRGALRELEGRAACWSDKREHRRALVRALTQTKQYRRCITAARGSTDPAVREQAEVCTAMAEEGNP